LAAWTAPAPHAVVGRDAILTVAISLGMLHAARRLSTHAGRRQLLGRWRRVTRWEFWPVWILYAPVLVWVAVLMIRHRSAAVFTAANPAIPAAGFIGESKSDILSELQNGGAAVAPFVVLRSAAGPDARAARASSFAADHGWPVVLKPDQGQRGIGVRIVRSGEELTAAARALSHDTIIQAYIPGVEFGLFYARRQHESHGRVVSITGKRFPVVTGDGRRTLEQLILDDARAVALWRVYTEINSDRVATLVPAGRQVQLCEIGSHCRGAVFVDARSVLTPSLEAAVDRAAGAMPGFFFGRFDVRSPSIEDLRRGRFTIVELNGVTSEPTHIYDRAYGVLGACRALCGSWTLAFTIGAEQAAAGARVWRVSELAMLALGYRRFHSAPSLVTSVS